MRVWLLTNEPSPYQAELFGAIARREGIELEIRFMEDASQADSQGQTERRFAHCVLNGWGPRWKAGQLRLHPQALREAAWGSFDGYVLSGFYTSFTFLLCALVLTLRRKPWVLWLERPREPWQEPRGAPWLTWSVRRGARKAALGLLMRFARGIFAIGSAAAESYRRLGAAPERVCVLPYCCDTSRFAQAEEDAVRRLRDAHQLHGKTVFLFSGQMIERKGVPVLLEAFARLARRREDVALVLLGDGPRRGEYQRRVPEDARRRTHFAGWRPQSELPAFFHAADVFVFPSRHDGWGVVINEACAAGLPIVASRQTGAAQDLVVEGENGFLLDRDDVDGFCEKMAFFADRPESIRRFGQRSREIVARFSVEEGAKVFHAAMAESVQPASERSQRVKLSVKARGSP